MLKSKNEMRHQALDDQTKARRSIREFDRFLTGGLMVVAAAAAALPWYVFFNPEKFGIRSEGWEALRNMPQKDGGGVEAVVPHIDEGPTSEGGSDVADIGIDALTTATVAMPASGEAKNNQEDGKSQPFPGGTRFKLLHVSNGRALIEDKSGMFLVQIGSILPDESRLLSMSNVAGKWQIVTSSNEIYAE
ncbi:flagellar protein [Agrobacterium sp. rho-13.3]|jgi:hypothetical protein|uniref:flagellar protein n=1 Tax=Agrobacterium sp. rho-13.3 TaxID=3072980 RepID=UPI002A129736|nr:flagellar protein [Agrobacterium sp. rho-13.3]MDX8310501.1 flagellar protein [Agrobacterium sp. rho-13.3]